MFCFKCLIDFKNLILKFFLVLNLINFIYSNTTNVFKSSLHYDRININDFLSDFNISLSNLKTLLDKNEVLYFGSKIIYEGTSSSIFCITRQQKIPLWSLNNLILNSTYKSFNKPKKKHLRKYVFKHYYDIETNFIVNKLIIKKINFLDSGEYKCLNTNNSFFLNVLITDWQEFNLKTLSQINFDIFIQKPIEIYCPYFNNSIWYRWSTKIKNYHQLIVDKPGKYLCLNKIENKKSSIKKVDENNEKIIDNFNEPKEFFILETAKIKTYNTSSLVKQNTFIKLECEARGFPLPDIQWFVGKSIIDVNREKFSRFELLNNLDMYPNSILIIYNLTIDDTNLYTCKARNLIENNWYEDEKTISIEVYAEKVYYQLLNLSGKTRIECSDNVKTWYFNNEKINFENSKNFFLENKNKSLIIKYPQLSNEGNYTCELYNGHLNITKLTPIPRVRLEEIENCRIDLKSVHASEGSPMIIECKSINPNQYYEMAWYKDGKLIGDELKRANQITLRLDNLNKKNKGIYTCAAINKVARYDLEFNLRVHSKYSYLWPISGIIAEIIILLTVIWWSEKNKNPTPTE